MGLWRKLLGGKARLQGARAAGAEGRAPLPEAPADAALEAVLRGAGVALPDLRWVRVGEDVHARASVPGAGAIAAWERLRGALAPRGWRPVLLGDAEAVRRHDEHLGGEAGSAAALARQLDAEPALDVSAWARAELEAQARECRAHDEPSGADTLERAVRLPDAPGEVEWPELVEPLRAYSIPMKLGVDRPLASVGLALVPAALPWHVPLQLRFGGWNACPGPEVQARVLRSWHGRFGAEPVGISGDVVELRVARPPATREAALRLAVEHFAFCNDIVDQGVGSLEGLAATLLGAPVWFFWWD